MESSRASSRRRDEGGSLEGSALESRLALHGCCRWGHLTGADLAVADVTWANLAGADLTGANLIGTNLTGANLTGANLFGARGLEANQLLGEGGMRICMWDDTTTFPAAVSAELTKRQRP